jgi:DNA primase
METKILNKDTILSMVSPMDITLKVLNLNEQPKNNISSPFSEDKKPSFQIFNNGNFKCYSTGKSGDCFQLVADLNEMDCKSDFKKVLQLVAISCNLTNYDYPKPLITLGNKVLEYKKNGCNQNKVEKKEFKIKNIATIPHTEKHIRFWQQFNVTIDLLKQFNVLAINEYSFFSERQNKLLNFKINQSEIAFAYVVNGNYEIYIPKRAGREKHFCNGLVANDIFGLQQLPEKVENLIICAGKKDTLVATAFGFPAITFRSETQTPSIEQIDTLKSRCNHLFICYDNDNGGFQGVKRIIENHDKIIQLQLPKTINDIADYFRKHTKDSFLKIIKTALHENK